MQRKVERAELAHACKIQGLLQRGVGCEAARFMRDNSPQ